MNNIYEQVTLFKLAVQGLVNSRQEASAILGISPSASHEEVKKAYWKKAKELHPDLNEGDELSMKILNYAKEIMLGEVSPSEPLSEQLDDEDSHEDLSYEDISKMRSDMGRDQFSQDFPGWEQELQREMGVDQYNSTFEGFDHDSDEEYNVDQEHKWEAALDRLDDIYRDLINDQFLEKIPEDRDRLAFLEKLQEKLNNDREFLDSMVKNELDGFNRKFKYNASDLKLLKRQVFEKMLRDKIRWLKSNLGLMGEAFIHMTKLIKLANRFERQAKEKPDLKLTFSKSLDRSWGPGAIRYDMHQDGKNVASAIVRPNPRKELGGMTLSDLVVRKDYRGTGLGRQLLRHVMSEHKGLFLRPQPYKDQPIKEDDLRKFYASEGFVPFGDELMKHDT